MCFSRSNVLCSHQYVYTVLTCLRHWHRFVGLDLEYTPKGRDQKVAVVQLCMRQHVLVYHFCRRGRNQICPASLKDFLTRKHITFSSVDIRGDKTMLARDCISIPAEYHVDIQDVFRIAGMGERAGMGKIAAVIIDPSYNEMKKECTNEMHNQWHWDPLSEKHLEYAAKDGYVSYELWNKILTIREGLSLGIPIWNDKLCERCKSGEDYKTYKRVMADNSQKAGQNMWEQGDEGQSGQKEENTWGVWAEDDEGQSEQSLDKPYDKLCVRCKTVEEYRNYNCKRLKAAWQKDTAWDHAEDDEGQTGQKNC